MGGFFSVQLSSIPDSHLVNANPDLAAHVMFMRIRTRLFTLRRIRIHCLADPDSNADSDLSFFIRIRIIVKG